MITIRIPIVLRKLTATCEIVTVTATTVQQAIGELENLYPGISERILDGSGKPHRFVNIFLNADDIRYLSDLSTPVVSGDEISIVPAMAGG